MRDSDFELCPPLKPKLEWATRQRQRALDLFFRMISVRPWDYEAAAAYGHLRAQQERMGKPLGPYDTQIAAQAIALGATLVSHDGAFRHVSGLAVEDWAGDL